MAVWCCVKAYIPSRVMSGVHGVDRCESKCWVGLNAECQVKIGTVYVTRSGAECREVVG